ncbi:unnamed protein product [Adineta steineri]|uniref:G-protein coupled receptors family 1 profile domain-containing protein n=1 Tax=Adineta steineri TaxID=433720 RepID=A0A815R1Y8_9BILA|nr:unnamed protein product [Adineta steineri]CAF1470382.1 unnamed protein product [Adineta steineri]
MVDLDTSQSRLIIFIILLIIIIPSIVCSIYIFYHFIRFHELRQNVNNHIILVLLFISFIQVVGELPLTLIFLRTGSVAILSDKFCQFWIVLNYTVCTGSLWTMAIASIERYWLVFHRTFFNKYIILLHYIPIILCIIYPLILYTYLVTIYTCTNTFDYSYWTCGGACYLYEPLLGTLDWVINGCTNVLLSTSVTWIIIIRVLIQKQRVNSQRTVWQRSRRIIMQLIVLSALYMIVWLPCVICFVITLFTPVPFLTALYGAYLSYYQYIACLLCPFACLLGSSEIRQVMRNTRVVQPSMHIMQPITQRLQQQT